MSEPKRWWFPAVVVGVVLGHPAIIFLAFTSAMLTNPESRHEVSLESIGWLASLIFSLGTAFFPLGLCGVVVWSSRALASHSTLFTLAGWFCYVVTVAVGMFKPRKLIFLLVVGMLILNIGGCYLPHVRHTIDNMV